MSTTGKACLLLPYIILEFLQLLAFGASIILTVGQHEDDGDGDSDTVVIAVLSTRTMQVMVMAVYSPGDVEISTTISIGVIGVMVMVILFYLWLCAVSLYQSLKEIQNLGSDQVKMAVMLIMIVMLVIRDDASLRMALYHQPLRGGDPESLLKI